MALRFRCENCGKEYKVGDENAGRTFKCKQCRVPFLVPTDGSDVAIAVGKASTPDSPAVITMPQGQPQGMAPPPGAGGGVNQPQPPMGGGYQNQPQGVPPQYAGAPAPSGQVKNSGMAITSMILGILGLLMSPMCFCGTIGIPLGLISGVLGFLGLKQVNAGTHKGKGFAIAGLVLGIIAFLIGSGWAILWMNSDTVGKSLGDSFKESIEEGIKDAQNDAGNPWQNSPNDQNDPVGETDPIEHDKQVFQKALQEYYDANNQSLGGGGPTVTGGKTISSPSAFQIVRPEDLKNSLAGYRLSPTGPKSMKLYYTARGTRTAKDCGTITVE